MVFKQNFTFMNSKPITDQQVRIMKDSWQFIVSQKIDAGTVFYDRLFVVAPGVRALFPDDMREQKKKLIGMLATVVNSLDKLDQIIDAVKSLGERHRGYGAAAEHYPVVGEVLLWTLAAALGEKWNDELQEAWATAYGLLSSVMIEAQQTQTV